MYNGAEERASYTYDEDGRCTSVTISREENGETLPLPVTIATMRQGISPRVSTMQVILPSMSMMLMATKLPLQMRREEESDIHTMILATSQRPPMQMATVLLRNMMQETVLRTRRTSMEMKQYMSMMVQTVLPRYQIRMTTATLMVMIPMVT